MNGIVYSATILSGLFLCVFSGPSKCDNTSINIKKQYMFKELPIFADCLKPPIECPNKYVTFWLYTQKTKDAPYELVPHKPGIMKAAPFTSTKTIKLLFHGFKGHKDGPPNPELRGAYFMNNDHNIISVDYKALANYPCYITAVRNLEIVGKCAAGLVETLVNECGFDLDNIHPIGFSLGAHAAGHLASYLKLGQFARLTGLDPALPLFVSTLTKITPKSAKFVDVLHTDGYMRGEFQALGTVDFFANGGSLQPGCTAPKEDCIWCDILTIIDAISSCSHQRAVEYYAESINSKVGFRAGCTTHSEKNVLFGENVPRNIKGSYYFETNSEPLYAIDSRPSSSKLYQSFEYFDYSKDNNENLPDRILEYGDA